MMFDSRREDLFSLCELTSEVFLSLGWASSAVGTRGGRQRGCIWDNSVDGECRDGQQNC